MNHPSTKIDGQMQTDLRERSLADSFAQFDAHGYVIFERVLDDATVAQLRAALAPYLAQGKFGRNEFEGRSTNRVYAMLAKSPVFAELATHPLALAFAERELGASCLLSACLAINLQPGETAQPWHYDDSSIKAARPRPALAVSMFWAIDETTALNGATEVVPGSHLWDSAAIAGAAQPQDFMKAASAVAASPLNPEAKAYPQPEAQPEPKTNPRTDLKSDPHARPDAERLAMPPGSLAIAKGTLWHRGGANRSNKPRLIITPQYCVGWARQLENMALAVPPAIAQTLPVRAQELLGYSIHPPFLGYVDGMHPRRLLR